MAQQVTHMRFEGMDGDESGTGLGRQETQQEITFPSHKEAEKMERWPRLRFSRTFFHLAFSQEKKDI